MISLGRQESVERLARGLAGADEALLARFHAVRAFSRTIRSSEYHVTNACNIRCRGCWFFTFDFDKQTKDQDRKSTRLNSSHLVISYAVFCLKKKKKKTYEE